MPKPKADLMSELKRLVTHWNREANTREKALFYDPKAIQLKVCAAELDAVMRKHLND